MTQPNNIGLLGSGTVTGKGVGSSTGSARTGGSPRYPAVTPTEQTRRHRHGEGEFFYIIKEVRLKGTGAKILISSNRSLQ
jgi:hypothetical protein